ncbi:MAG TPA: N-acetyltransferase [Bacteroidales bacterium]|nr:N-acetyltransferase [Bacteroidales bacterium]
MKITIKEITSKNDLKKFIKFPNKLYEENNFYVPPLISAEIETLSKDKNPAFDFCEAKYWLAYNEGNTIVGRIAGIINHKYNKKVGKQLVRFGWLDFIEDIDVLKALIQAVVKFANEKGAVGIHGPFGFSEFDASGILIEGFDEIPTAYGKYNYPYYSQMIERLGFEKEVDWVEFRVTVPNEIPVRYSQIERSIAEKYKLQSVKLKSKKEVLNYANEIFQLLNKEYENIHGFISLTPNQIDALKKQFIPLLRLKYVSVVLNSENKVVGFGICLPSLSRALQQSRGNLFPFGFLHIQKALRVNDTIDTLLIAIHSDYRNKGVNSMIFNDIGNSMIATGIKYIETTRMLEHNLFIQNLWNKFEMRNHKRARCYFKKL